MQKKSANHGHNKINYLKHRGGLMNQDLVKCDDSLVVINGSQKIKDHKKKEPPVVDTANQSMKTNSSYKSLYSRSLQGAGLRFNLTNGPLKVDTSTFVCDSCKIKVLSDKEV